MLKTMPFRSQQGRILSMIADLEGRLSPETIAADPLELAMKTQHLIRWVQVHHAFEHESLFTPVRRQSTRSEREALRRFADGLDRMASLLSDHETRWNAQAIAAAPQEFATQTAALADAIRERMVLEQRHLFPLVESVMARATVVRDYLEA